MLFFLLLCNDDDDDDDIAVRVVDSGDMARLATNDGLDKKILLLSNERAAKDVTMWYLSSDGKMLKINNAANGNSFILVSLLLP